MDTPEGTLVDFRNQVGDLQRRLAEVLEQQTATAEVLRVINASPGDLAPVFDVMVGRAAQLCEADEAAVRTFDGELLHLAATQGTDPSALEQLRQLGPTAPLGLYEPFARGEAVVHYADARDTDTYRNRSTGRSRIDARGIRTWLAVALRKEGRLLGVINVHRREVRSFTGKQIALLESFAAQAVIAMENARLITETQEALDQQTATAEVLSVINSSPGELAPVFDAMLQNALRLCDARLGMLYTFDGESFQMVGHRGVAPALAEVLRKPVRTRDGSFPTRGSFARLLRGEPVVHDADVADTEGYRVGMPVRRALVDIGGARTNLWVALRKDDKVLGVVVLYRREVRPFSDKQIALLQNFAQQAVIAIENARLITQTQEALDQQTATAEVLQVINASPGDLAPVFEAILEKAHSLCGVAFGSLLLYDGERFRPGATGRLPPPLANMLREPFVPEPGGPLTQLIAGAPPQQVNQEALLADGSWSNPRARISFDEAGVRIVLFVPLRKDGRLLGAITAYRREARAFSDKEIVLLQNFAAQAVIAMENARLITETRAARDDAETALHELQSAQRSLVQAQKMAALGQLTAGIAHEIKNPLNFVNNFAGLSAELLAELTEEMAPALEGLDAERRGAIDETIEMLTGNLGKIAEHGQRADNIVKSMLEHSRGVSGERRTVDLNSLIEEALNLAYHGARAQNSGFNITLERDYAPGLAPIELAPQEMTRVLLNLIGNGFYAADKRAKANGDIAYRPTLSVATREVEEAVEFRIRDNGTGIPTDIRDKLFQPFFTTKPTGEGTGLGLSISYDIVTQQHGGTIEVASEDGAFTEFTIRLPRSL